MRSLYLFHRWLGISAGVMLVVWYGSGLYVHWRAVPSVLSVEEQHRALGAPFSLSEVEKDFTEILRTYKGIPVVEMRLRRAGSRLVYEVRESAGSAKIFDAQTGERLSPVSELITRDVAQGFMPGVGIQESALLQTPDAYSAKLPMPVYRVIFADAEGTTVYVSPGTASILARTRSRERLYYLLGSMPHFLNFNVAFLRNNKTIRNGLLWGLNAAAGLLVATGVVLTLRMILQRGVLGGLGSRHLILRRWHYLLGLGFSLTSLLFIVTGFFYVLDGSPPPVRVVPKAEELRAVVQPIGLDSSSLIPVTHMMSDLSGVSMVLFKRILDVPLYDIREVAGQAYVIRGDTGESFRVDDPWIRKVAEAFWGHSGGITEIHYLTDYDAYYYARDGRIPTLPVYRVRSNESTDPLLYLSPTTGEVVGRASKSFRLFRWVIVGFHTWDWPFLLHRPVLRDSVVILLVLGGLALSLTGLYLGIIHLVGFSRPVEGVDNSLQQQNGKGL